jgi:3-hydroxyisobutyrate dehydrogenase-like beta-hydroxyacid dehydrogenase
VSTGDTSTGEVLRAGFSRVGFIGLGSQGAPMARKIIEGGFPVTLWARHPETLAPFAGSAAETAGSAAELGAVVDLACVCVLDDAGVEQVVSGAGGLLAGMRPGTMIAVHSTVHPDTCVRLAGQAAERGVTLVDAPVSGGAPQAEQGRLLVMTGGDHEAVERARPVFETYGNPVVHLGPLGAGQRAKLINNTLLAANLGVAESAFALARRLDVDLGQLSVVLAHGSGGSFGAGLLRRGDFTLASMGGMVGPLLQKDVRILAGLAEAAGVKPGTVLDAADVALDSLGSPR